MPDGYSLTQFRYHLKQNIVAIKPSTVLKMLHQPGAKMYIDFAGDKLSYVDMETGELIQVETFAAVLPCSGYTFITCVPSQSIEQFLGAVDAAIRFYGGAVHKSDTRIYAPLRNKTVFRQIWCYPDTARTTFLLSNWKTARPYISLFLLLSLLTSPSMSPFVLYNIAFLTAFMS